MSPPTLTELFLFLCWVAKSHLHRAAQERPTVGVALACAMGGAQAVRKQGGEALQLRLLDALFQQPAPTSFCPAPCAVACGGFARGRMLYLSERALQLRQR